MTATPEPLQRKLDTLPDQPGVYLWKDAAGLVLYVGKAKRLRSRVRSYFTADHATSLKTQYLVRQIADVETIVVANEAQSLLLENNLIKEYQPRFNVRLKDDKSYPSIAVTTGEPFPRVLVTRRLDLPGARYFGPYTDVTQLRRALVIIRRLYTVRSCADDLPREQRERPCLDYHIGRCRAPCVGWQTQTEYRGMIDEVLDFLAGRTVDVRSRVRDAMLTASERQDYERAGRLRDQLKWLEQVDAPASVEVIGTGDADIVGFARDGDDAVGALLRVREGRVVAREHTFLENLGEETDEQILNFLLVRSYVPMPGRVRRLILPFPPAEIELLQELMPETEWHVPQRGIAHRWLDLADQNARHLLESLRIESFETDERAGDPVYALGRDLGLNVVPRSMICIDISTNQGKDTVGSLVWFEAGRPRKAEYRKFKIKGEAQQDDYAAIHEVLTRYLTRRQEERLPLPDLIVIDGGKGQLSAAADAAAARGVGHIPMISLAKKEEEIFFPGRPESLRLSRRAPSLRLLQRIRDETHRFGVAYNRKRRTQRTITSALLDIPGVGPTRRRVLLERFGSLAGVRSATAAEIASLPGFSATLAERILAAVRA
ncbi:MAG: excinuclease ABC subunit UvrC [Gemmatimonadetes bacterium]|nr:excinuclease ABC subunit UvrC [Gemmatimonadota bacterium]MBK7924287.1 excinuclease ABC subunit UvrC [Gemmatimonadota bacterium]MBK9691467.1 excinuclease ABC subunit UvrC [Gemmatimonadota bacterium]